MPEDHWARLNTNHFRDVWTPFAHRANGGNQTPDAVVGAWSSMAWDSARGARIFWGCGPANYPGNEIYLWLSSTLARAKGRAVWRERGVAYVLNVVVAGTLKKKTKYIVKQSTKT